jgi:hypothetical protein
MVNINIAIAIATAMHIEIQAYTICKMQAKAPAQPQLGLGTIKEDEARGYFDFQKKREGGLCLYMAHGKLTSKL